VNGNSAVAAAAPTAAAAAVSSSSSNDQHLSLQSKRAVEMLLRFGAMGTIDAMPQVYTTYINIVQQKLCLTCFTITRLRTLIHA
jgi:hypothetical protein